MAGSIDSPRPEDLLAELAWLERLGAIEAMPDEEDRRVAKHARALRMRESPAEGDRLLDLLEADG